jgi:3D (Asp-Asp-Asp) domain-containing protein
MTQLITQANAPHEMPVVLAPEPVVEVVVEAPAPVLAEPLWQTFEVTAYTAGYESTGKRPGDVGYGITASGEHVQANYTLACPPSLPFGQRLEIEGIGERVCTDRGSAIKEGRLDIYIPELKDALAFGRQTVEVRIIEEES